MKVLVADDESTQREILKIFLASHGYCVIEAENGLQAISLALLEKPDLIIIDHNMPEIMGFDAIKKIRKTPGFAEVPFVVVTINFEIQALQEDEQMTRCSFLPKPYSPEQLLAAIRYATGQPFPRATQTSGKKTPTDLNL